MSNFISSKMSTEEKDFENEFRWETMATHCKYPDILLNMFKTPEFIKNYYHEQEKQLIQLLQTDKEAESKLMKLNKEWNETFIKDACCLHHLLLRTHSKYLSLFETILFNPSTVQ